MPVRILRLSLNHPDALTLCDAVQAEYAVLYGGGDTSTMAAADFIAPNGSFLVGYHDDRPVASAAWRLVPADRAGSRLRTGEIKRVYVAPEMRRRGSAGAMMRALENDAHAAGIERLVLETGPMQPAAIALYRDLGYTDTNGGGWSEYGDHPGVVILEAMLPRG